jgi:hypothetical protein
MLFLIRAGGLVAALAVADPALAQQASRHTGKDGRVAPHEGVLLTGFLKRCGSDFVCYTGIPLRCTANTRPYQNIPAHQCFCLPDGCR